MESTIERDEPAKIEQIVDRFWFLLKGRRPDSAPHGVDAAGTLVIRDGACIVVSVEAAAVGWPEGTLLFRLRSATTPCVGCVERAIGLARARAGRLLSPDDVREMLRLAVSRCAGWGADPTHTRNSASARPAPVEATLPSRPTSSRGRDGDLWLVL